jgi:hypothetical protein
MRGEQLENHGKQNQRNVEMWKKGNHNQFSREIEEIPTK